LIVSWLRHALNAYLELSEASDVAGPLTNLILMNYSIHLLSMDSVHLTTRFASPH
jgi:hypothetical protein